MDIVLRVVGVVKVDDKFHVLNICKIALKCGIKDSEDSTQKCARATTTTTSKQKVSIFIKRVAGKSTRLQNTCVRQCKHLAHGGDYGGKRETMHTPLVSNPMG